MEDERKESSLDEWSQRVSQPAVAPQLIDTIKDYYYKALLRIARGAPTRIAFRSLPLVANPQRLRQNSDESGSPYCIKLPRPTGLHDPFNLR